MTLARAVSVLFLGLVPVAAFAADPAFSNQTAAAGLTMTHATSNFSHWDYVGGGAVGDFNRDGWQDLFVCSGGNGNVPDKLFINNGDGTFSDQAAAWGLTAIHLGKGATVADYNGDGWPDLYVLSAGPLSGAAPGHHKLYKNNGNGTFTNLAAAAGVNFSSTASEDGFSAAFADYDLDGDLDLFVCGFASGNSGSRLFRNNANGTFTDITAAIGMFSGVPQMFAFTPLFVDMDGDRYPDLPLISDFGTSRYFRNNKNGTFSDVTLASKTSKEENGMGGCVGDFNNDLMLDFYATSILCLSTGWTGNKLYRNDGNHVYTEYSNPASVWIGGYGWGTVAVDFNHDGWEDLAETNGPATCGNPQRAYLYMNNGNNTFAEKAQASGLNHTGNGRGMARFDYDNDGDQDLVIMANNGPLAFFRNDLSGPNTNWLRVFLKTTGSPGLAPDGFGARVKATYNDGSGAKTIMRYLTSAACFEAANEASAHFGLGAAGVVSELKIEWPDGTTKSLANVAVNQTITVWSVNCPGDVNFDKKVDQGDLGILLAAYGCTGGGCPGDLNYDGKTDQADLGILLANYGAVCP